MSSAEPSEKQAEATVGRLPECVRWLCEPLLDLEPGRALLALNPALAVATSHRAGSGPAWRSRLDELLALPARDLSERLGFGGTRRALRTLAKLEPESASTSVLRLLAELLHDSSEKWLFHLPALNTAVVQILAVPTRRELATFSLLLDLCRDLDDVTGQMVVATIDDVRSLRLSLTPKRTRAPIRSFSALMEEDAVLWDREERRQLCLPFTPPPPPDLRAPPGLQGHLQFDPLRDIDAVRAHGERQGNCLARRWATEGDLVLGRRFYYRVTARPPGAGQELEGTLAVVPHGSTCRVEQLRLQDNHPAPSWLDEAVECALMGGPR